MPGLLPSWRWTAAWLRRGPLAGLEVRLRRCRVPADSSADCDRAGRVYTVRVSRQAAEDAAVLLLLHEAAHVLAWSMEGTDHPAVPSHDGHWGIAYARLWREFMAALNEEEG